MPLDDLIGQIRKKLKSEHIMSDEDIMIIALKCVIVCQNNDEFEAALMVAVVQYGLEIYESYYKNNKPLA